MPSLSVPSSSSSSPQPSCEPLAKKIKVNHEPAISNTSSCFRSTLFNDESALAKSYSESSPYLHIVIPDLINAKLLTCVRKEILSNIAFTLKETDIYKVNQSGDLANLDGLNGLELDKLPSLFTLRNAIYSEEFRGLVSKVTGCGELSGCKMDMSINLYSKGCHLLCHDDVIGTRRVSFILYLPDPSIPWTLKDGGALELYPCIEPNTPATSPSRVITPQFNQFAMFTVQPGASFHSVQEVVASRDRLSISGWFHFPQESNHSCEATASLDQLEAARHDILFTPFPNPPSIFSEADAKLLSKHINPLYLTPSTLTQIRSKFLDESSIQLTDFLIPETWAIISSTATKLDERDGYSSGTADMNHDRGVGENEWICQGSPVKHRFLQLTDPLPSSTSSKRPTSSIFTQTLTSLQNLFESASFHSFLQTLTQLPLKSHRGAVRRFRPGLDYTLATDPRSVAGVLDVTWMASTGPASLWCSDGVGGYDCYLTGDDGTETENDPSVYRSGGVGGDDCGALLTVSAGSNVLSVVFREPAVMRFVKYVSAAAKGSRWDVAFEYEVEAEDEDEPQMEAEGVVAD